MAYDILTYDEGVAHNRVSPGISYDLDAHARSYLQGMSVRVEGDLRHSGLANWALNPVASMLITQKRSTTWRMAP
jgi:hypothetical protein